MVGYEAKNHEHIGGDFLEKIGFTSRVVEICKVHVQANRYLCWKNPNYYYKLTNASKTTLTFKGGVMSEKEGFKFKKKLLCK